MQELDPQHVFTVGDSGSHYVAAEAQKSCRNVWINMQNDTVFFLVVLVDDKVT